MSNRISSSVGGTVGVAESPPQTRSAAMSAGELLPEPSAVPSADLLVTMLLASASQSREAHRALRSAKSEERAAAQADEIAKMHDEADNALVGGIVGGGLQAAGGAMTCRASLASAQAEGMKATAQDSALAQSSDTKNAVADLGRSAAAWTLSAALANSGASLSQACTQAHGKELEADAKSAQMRAEGAKEQRDEAGEGVNEERELEQAVLRAYEALLGSRAQQAQSVFGTRG